MRSHLNVSVCVAPYVETISEGSFRIYFVSASVSSASSIVWCKNHKGWQLSNLFGDSNLDIRYLFISTQWQSWLNCWVGQHYMNIQIKQVESHLESNITTFSRFLHFNGNIIARISFKKIQNKVPSYVK